MGDMFQTLLAISAGAVFMGANSYIGNAPNFMVKAIAESSDIKMPSFFGYIIKMVASHFGSFVHYCYLDILLMRITKVTTKTGDDGQTGLGNGERVSKNSLRVNAMGAVDKLNSIIGWARLNPKTIR